jgi:hypothetical protein
VNAQNFFFPSWRRKSEIRQVFYLAEIEEVILPERDGLGTPVWMVATMALRHTPLLPPGWGLGRPCHSNNKAAGQAFKRDASGHAQVPPNRLEGPCRNQYPSVRICKVYRLGRVGLH